MCALEQKGFFIPARLRRVLLNIRDSLFLQGKCMYGIEHKGFFIPTRLRHV